MPTVAEQLRRAREQQQLNVYQVAEITKIKTDHIRALEAGDYETFSAPVYIRGFVRTYAKALKLDAPQLLAALDAELSHSEKFRELPSLSNEPRSLLDLIMLRLSQTNWRIVLTTLAIALFIVIAMTGLRGCGTQKESDALKNLGPGLYKPSKPDPSGELLPLPTPQPGR
jgi:cytoskeletal protein RodZ